MRNGVVVGVISIVIAIVIVGSVLIPVLDDASGGSWDEVISTVYNEDPILTFDKQTENYDLDMSVTIDGSDLVITCGNDTVTTSYGVTFILAADNSAVFINNRDDIILTWSEDNTLQSVNLDGDFTATISDDTLIINDGTQYEVPAPTSYLYIPSSTGNYGSFASGDLAKRESDPIIAAGSFAGVVGYNDMVSLVGDAMTNDITTTDTEITNVSWIKTVSADPETISFDPSTITIEPLDPSIIDDPDAGLMVATPQYTDGDWGYNLTTSSGVTKASIVSYSGQGGDITIPTTIGGYVVSAVGNGTDTVFDPSLNVTSLTIDIVGRISSKAFYGCTGINGPLKLSNTTWVQNNAFYNTGITGTVVIPESLTIFGTTVFSNTPFNGLVVLPQNASWNYNTLSDTSIKEVLNLGADEITTTSYGLNADAVQDFIDAETYIAPATITEIIHHSGGGSGTASELYAAIPIVVIAAILLASISMFLVRRGE